MVRRSAIGSPLSVAEVCEGISEALRQSFGTEVWVRGSISGLNRSANGHVYFSLVDPDEAGGQPSAVLDVALFAKTKYQVNAILKRTNAVRMEDGIEVSIAGRIEHYARTGRVQLIMTMIDPNYTLGKLAANREATLRRLDELGLLHRNRLVPLPVLPIRIALVTSAGSAADADFTDELGRTGIGFAVQRFDARVQGPEAPGSLERAIIAAAAAEVDLVAVVRGGGAKTDLAAFDDLAVATAIANCTRPVVVGVGHDIDRSIADEVAAISQKTPTAAAGWIIQRVAEFDRRVDVASDRLVRAAGDQLESSRRRVSHARQRLAASARAALTGAERRADRAGHSLASATQRALTSAAHRLDRNDLRVAALDPVSVMARGWTITRDAGGRVLHSVHQVEPGTTLWTETADGSVVSTVDETIPAPEDVS